MKLGDKENCQRSIDRAYEIVSHSNGEDFAKQPDAYMKQYNTTYKEYGLEAYKPL